MAAGRVDVARREDIRYARKETYHYTYGHDHDQHTSRRSGFTYYSCSTREVCGRELVGGTRDWKHGEISGKGRCNSSFVNKSRAGDNEIPEVEDGGPRPPTKRRKFSPIVWDRNNKEVGISSKNRIITKSTPFCLSPSLTESSEQSNVVTCDDVSKFHGKQISDVISHVAASVGNSEQCSESNEKLGQVDDEEYIEVRHISTSRWASEEDSPRKLFSSTAGSSSSRSGVVCVDTPESGEFLGETFEGSQVKLSTYDCRDIFVDPTSGSCCLDDGMDNRDFMERVERNGKVAGVCHSESELEDDECSSMFEEPAAPKPRSMNMLQGCRSVFDYEKIRKINEGTYGVVYKARDKETDEIVALKKVKMGLERDGFPLSSLREINILLSLQHPSVVKVKEVVMDGFDDVFMVMEYMEYDLKMLIEVMKQPFSEKEVKCLMLQLLEGVKYLHDNWILHRDLKTSNLLLSSSGKLKICDFGMSRQYGSPLRPFTSLVVTLWYRAPELLLGAEQYSTAIDMWSIGCIMAELLAKQPLFDGKSELEQLHKIFRTLGTPNDVTWPGFAQLPGAKAKFVKQSRNALRDEFPAVSFKGSPVLSDQGFDLLSRLLTYDPEKRITAEAALEHGWFHVESEQELLSTQEFLAKKMKSMK